MLQITVRPPEFFDDEKQEFVQDKGQDLQLEHSLVSLSKWESKWKKPFISKEEKSQEESIDYIRCMTVTQNVNPQIYDFISSENIKAVAAYIDSPMTATTFARDDRKVTNRDIVTAEIIYYWMIALNIPFECQKWHLNRLLTLINVCNIKNQPQKKLKGKALYEHNKALNDARRKQLNTGG